MTNEITPEDLGIRAPSRDSGNGDTFQDKVAAFKHLLVTDALTAANGNQAAAARSLGLAYHQYRYFLKTCGG